MGLSASLLDYLWQPKPLQEGKSTSLEETTDKDNSPLEINADNDPIPSSSSSSDAEEDPVEPPPNNDELLHVARLMEGLLSKEDEGLQLVAVMELCQHLLIADKTSFEFFPTYAAIPALVDLLQMERNEEIMNNAARALTYLVEVIPSSRTDVVEQGLTTILTKLEQISSIDVAEQCIRTLDILSSHKFASLIREKGGIAACLQFLDFYSTPTQIQVLRIVSNCVRGLGEAEFQHVAGYLDMLVGKLNANQDMKIIEAVVIVFFHLCKDGNYHDDLKELICSKLVQNLINLLSLGREVVDQATILLIIKMFGTICTNLSTFVVTLLDTNILRCLTTLIIQRDPADNTMMFGVLGMILQLYPAVDEVCVPTGKNERINYLEANPEISTEIATLIYTELVDNHNGAGCRLMKSACLAALLCTSRFTPVGNLVNLFSPKEIGNIVACSIVSEHMEIALSALSLCSMLMEKAGVQFKLSFRRAGVFHQIRLMNESCEPTADELQTNPKFLHPKKQLQLKCATFLAKFCTEDLAGVCHGADTMLKESLDKLKEVNTFQDGLVTLTKSIEDISPFEVSNTDFIPVITTFLTKPESIVGLSLVERNLLFLNVFAKFPAEIQDTQNFIFESTALSNLVELLHSCISQTDRIEDIFKVDEDKDRKLEVSDPSIISIVEDPSDLQTAWENGTLEGSFHPSFTPQNFPSGSNLIHLVKIIHNISNTWQLMYPTNTQLSLKLHSKFIPILPDSQFVNSKISAKAKYTLKHSRSIPTWLKQLSIDFPFLLDFETKRILFYSMVFGKEAADRLGSTSPGLINKQRVTVSRENILNQAQEILLNISDWATPLEIEYQEEEGFGQGPTLEFYYLVSKELSKKCLNLWRCDEACEDEFVHQKEGLFPKPLAFESQEDEEVLKWYRFLGIFVAKAIRDMRWVDMPFSTTFYQIMQGLKNVAPSDLVLVDAGLASSVQQLFKISESGNEKGINELGLEFTLPGYPLVELIKGGTNIPVDSMNIQQYLKLVGKWTLDFGISKQIAAFKEGFNRVFPLSSLQIFSVRELENLLCGESGNVEGEWEFDHLSKYCKPDHGYSLDSDEIKWLFQIMTAFDFEEKRQFLRFITGSPRLPIGGFKGFRPLLTIVKKEMDGTIDQGLPSVMTCANYLKLPSYSSIEIMRERVTFAVQEGQGAFHLS